MRRRSSKRSNRLVRIGGKRTNETSKWMPLFDLDAVEKRASGPRKAVAATKNKWS